MTQKIILKNITDLHGANLVKRSEMEELEKVAKKFSVSVTPSVMEAMNSEEGSAVFSQYVPAAEELEERSDEFEDPIGDEIYTPVKGITHRYPDRLLLKPIHTCAVYCRFCFRREKVGRADQALNKSELEEALSYISGSKDVWEVILSGGDPLLLNPAKLSGLIMSLNDIEHVKVIRIHTRMPLVAPEKINKLLLNSLKTDKALFTVIHCNSHEELTPAVCESLKKMVDSGIPLLSQSVLLRGVNDNPALLEKLFRGLVENRVKPYYLHQADKAKGTSHFRVPLEEGREIAGALRGRVSGICQPLYVLDIPGGKGKVPIGQTYLKRNEDGYQVTDWQGCEHLYKD